MHGVHTPLSPLSFHVIDGVGWLAERISQDAPWFFEMRELLGQRPNSNPVGLGNSTTDIEMDAIIPTGHEEQLDEDTGDGVAAPEAEDGDQSPNELEDAAPAVHQSFLDDTFSDSNADDDDVEELPQENEDDEKVVAGKKRKAVSNAELSADSNKTPAKRGTTSAKPTPAAASSKMRVTKKPKAIADFEGLAMAEEATQQKELDVQQARTHLNIAKVQAKAEIKKNRQHLVVELHMAKMKHTFEMEKLRASSQMANMASYNHFSSSPSLFDNAPGPSTYDPSRSALTSTTCSHSGTPFSAGFMNEHVPEGFTFLMSLVQKAVQNMEHKFI